MSSERLILCGPVSAANPPFEDRHPVALDIYGTQQNVRLRLECVRKALWTTIPAALRDLLDVAVYVYCADQATTRANGGRVDGQGFGTGWRRRLFFRIAVRRPDLWEGLSDRLTDALSFLSDDEYHFEFTKLSRDCALDKYIDWETTSFNGSVEEVVLFSGGLDSLAGAVQEALVDKRQVLLVHHRSTSKLAARHDGLVRDLGSREGVRAPLHMPVWANKQKRLGREHTQRSRSVLFAALGAMFAVMSGLNRVRFYENGVISLNLPPSAQLVGARASRTTHPRVLKAFGDLVTGLLGKTFAFENPFLWKTKTDVAELLRDNGCADMIGCSTSCAHTWGQTLQHTHCGMCSQCIDRRLAVLAAQVEDHDPATHYRTDPVLGRAPDTYSKTMLVAFMEMVERVERMSATDFVTRFGELARVLRHGPGGATATAFAAYQLYRRHAEQIRKAVNRAAADNVDAITRRLLPENCLLRLVCEGPTGETAPVAPPAEPPTPPGNSFVRRADYWSVRYGNGEEKYYQADVGFTYLRILFENPNKVIPTTDLVAQAQRANADRVARLASVADAAEAGVAVTGTGKGQRALDDTALAQALKRLQELEELQAQAEASDSPTRLDEIEELAFEAMAIRKRVDRDSGPGGRVRELDDLRNQIRDRAGVRPRDQHLQLDCAVQPELARLVQDPERPAPECGFDLEPWDRHAADLGRQPGLLVRGGDVCAVRERAARVRLRGRGRAAGRVVGAIRGHEPTP